MSAKYEVWIQHLAMTLVGPAVKAGQVLFNMYSPDLITAQQEYVIARQSQQALQNSSPQAINTTEQLVKNALQRFMPARYGLLMGDVQEIISTAVGGETITTMVEGRERFAVTVRYPRELRDSPQAIAEHILVPTASGAMIPLGQLAHLSLSKGSPSIRTENAALSAYIYVDMRGRDIQGYVQEAKQAVEQAVKFPPGYYITWSGQFEYMERAKQRLQIVIPVTLGIIFVLLYLNFGRLTETLIVMLSVPFALVGGVWLVWYLGYNVSVAVGVGFIALAGVAAETGVVMLIYLDQAYQEQLQHCQQQKRVFNELDLYKALITGAAERLRPKVMTVTAIMAGLLPILWSTGTGSEVMRRIAAPMVGGMVSSTLLTLIVIPALYAICKQREIVKLG